MSAAIGVLMLVLMVVLIAIKLWSEAYLDHLSKGIICGLGICAWCTVAVYLIAGGAA